MNTLTLPGYTVVAASLLPQGTGTTPSALFVAVPAAVDGRMPEPPRPVMVGRWCFATGCCSYSESFVDLPAAGADPPRPALTRGFEAFAAHLAAEAAGYLARGTPLSVSPPGSFILHPLRTPTVYRFRPTHRAPRIPLIM